MSDFTRHGGARAQKRGIPSLVIDWLMAYGRVARRRGADVYFFDHAGRKALRRSIGAPVYRRIADLLDAYAVVSDEGQIITTGWRYKRIKP